MKTNELKTLGSFLIRANSPREYYALFKDLTLEEFLKTYQEGHLILCLFARMNSDKLRELTLAKAHCANTVRHLMKDKRSIYAIDTAIRFGEGKASREELDAAAKTARDITWQAYYAYAPESVYCAYKAADDAASSYGVMSAFYAGEAIYCATKESDEASFDYFSDNPRADSEKNKLETAEICRKYLPLEIWDQSKL